MATVTVNINATDNMSAVIAGIQAQLNQLQQQANINIGGRAQQQAGQMVNYTSRLFENMLSNMGTRLWNSFTKNIKSAYNEIKAIDDELVVVRRVTGKTNEELAGMSQNAMKVAQTYGIAASKYLEGVADFTRAGYKDQAEGLAELSVQLQRAGDVSADVANQYILAIDKAYGLQGNIEALTAAMDGANQIGNEYATNVGEIAAGIGKIATIASTAHVGINELTAALGTITAVTQRSGTEAATALRAIFLNIIGDTSTEIEEGAKWTAGEIEGLRQVLELYAPEVVRAAEATGTLIDPMEAIGALAKSYREGVLTEAKLFSMVSDIGGKLRTNQLMVLIKNWDMYQNMMNTFANASGSIDKEVQNSLDSITVKTERLKASWVALVNSTISTGMIKGVLDGLNTAVQAVDNLGNALTIVLGLVTALKAQRIATLFAGITGGNAATVANLTASVRGFGLAVAAVGVAISAVNAIVKSHNDSLESSAQAAVASGAKAGQSSQEIMKLYTAYITAEEGTETYTNALHALAEALGMTAEAAENAGTSIEGLATKQMQQAVADAKAAIQVYNKTKGETWLPKTYTISFREYSKELITIVDNYKELFEMSDDVAIFDTTASLDKLISQYEAAEKMQADLRLFADQNGINIANFKPYLEVQKYLQETNAQYKEALTLMEAYATAEANLQVKEMAGYKDMANLMKQMADGEEVSVTKLQEYAKTWDDLISSIKDSDFNGYGKWIRESLIGILDKEFPEIAKWSQQWADAMNGGAKGATNGVDAQTESVKRLTLALSEATKAKNAFDAAMKQDAENKGFTDYQSAYSAYAEEIEAGRVNSRRAMAAAQYLMAGTGTDFDTLYREKGYKGVNAAIANGPFKTLYGDAERTYGEGFVTLLGNIANENGDIIDSNGNVVASYKQVEKEVQFTVNDLKGLADVTGLSVDQTWDAIKALGVYGDYANEIDKYTNSLEALGEEAGFLVESTNPEALGIDYGKLLSYARESGISTDQWQSMKDWLYLLNEIGEVEIQNVPDVEEGWQNYNDLIENTAENAEQAKESAETTKETLEEAAETVEDTKLPDLSEGAGGQNAAQELLDQYKDIIAQIDEIVQSGNYEITFTANGAPAVTTIQTVEGQANIASRERTIQFDVNGNVVSVLDVLKNEAGEVAETREIHYDVDGNVTSILSTLYDDAGRVSGTREIHYDVDGNVVSILSTLYDDAGRVAETRTIHYNADGTIDKLDVVRTNANDPEITEHLVYYYTNGNVDHIEYTKEKAGEPVGPHLVAYYSDGNIDHISWIEETAKGVVEHEYKVNFGTDGSIIGLSETIKTATGVQNIEYQFLFGTDGQIIGLKETEDTAEGVKYKIHNFTFGADGKPMTDKIEEYIVYADGTTSEPFEYTLTAEDGPAYENIMAILGFIEDDYAGQQSEYDLDATTEGVQSGVDEAKKTIGDAIANTDTTFHLKALFGDLFDKPDIPLPSPYVLDPWNTGSFDPTKGIPLNKLLSGINRMQTPSAELEITADKESAKEAAEEAQKIASVTLGQNPVPFIPEEGYDGEYVGTLDGNDIYTVSFEIEDQGVFDDIMYIDKESGKPHVISIQTAGDGAQTISETVYTLDGAVESQNVITVDAEGNAVTDLETIEELLEFIDKTIRFTVNADTSESQNRLKRLKDTLDGIKSKTVTVTTETKTTGANVSGTHAGSGGSGTSNEVSGGSSRPRNLYINANGTNYFPGGYSLVNEKGPEIVTANGLAQIYANGFPTIANIPRGAQIFNAQETAAILGSKMTMPAYAEGTVSLADLIGGIPGMSGGAVTVPVIHTKPTITIPEKKKEEEEEKKEEKSHGSGSGSGSSNKTSDEEEEDDEFWNTIREYIDYGMKKIQYQIEGYQDDITAIERARDALIKPIEEELEDLDYSLQMLQYEVTLLERARDDAVKPLDKEIERLEKARDINKEDLDLEEKRQALENAREQRTVRFFNEATGQWEWMADQKAIKDAEDAYNEALADYEITLLKRQRDAINDEFQEQIDALDDQEEVLRRRQEDLEHERTKIEYEYGESIDPLQDQLDALQQTYDDLDKYYQRLVDAVEVPMESLTEALREMTSAGSNYMAQYGKTVELLDALYAMAPTWSAVDVGDLGKYKPTAGPYGNYDQRVDQSTNVYVDGVKIEGKDAQEMKDILSKHMMYRDKKR